MIGRVGFWKLALPGPDVDIQKVHGHSSAQLLDSRSLVLSLLIATSTVLQGLHVYKVSSSFMLWYAK